WAVRNPDLTTWTGPSIGRDHNRLSDEPSGLIAAVQLKSEPAPETAFFAGTSRVSFSLMGVERPIGPLASSICASAPIDGHAVKMITSALERQRENTLRLIKNSIGRVIVKNGLCLLPSQLKAKHFCGTALLTAASRIADFKHSPLKAFSAECRFSTRGVIP